MDGGAWWAAVHGVAKSWTRLTSFTFSFHFNALEKEMATHSTVLAWRIPGTGEPGWLPSMGSHRVGHGWSNLAAAVGIAMIAAARTVLPGVSVWNWSAASLAPFYILLKWGVSIVNSEHLHRLDCGLQKSIEKDAPLALSHQMVLPIK